MAIVCSLSAAMSSLKVHIWNLLPHAFTKAEELIWFMRKFSGQSLIFGKERCQDLCFKLEASPFMSAFRLWFQSRIWNHPETNSCFDSSCEILWTFGGNFIFEIRISLLRRWRNTSAVFLCLPFTLKAPCTSWANSAVASCKTNRHSSQHQRSVKCGSLGPISFYHF